MSLHEGLWNICPVVFRQIKLDSQTLRPEGVNQTFKNAKCAVVVENSLCQLWLNEACEKNKHISRTIQCPREYRSCRKNCTLSYTGSTRIFKKLYWPFVYPVWAHRNFWHLSQSVQKKKSKIKLNSVIEYNLKLWKQILRTAVISHMNSNLTKFMLNIPGKKYI